MEDNDHIEAIENKIPEIAFAAVLQMLDQLQDFASSFVNTEMQRQLATIIKYLQDVRLQCRQETRLFLYKFFSVADIFDLYIYRLKTVSFLNFSKNYSLHPVLPLLSIDNSQKSQKSKNNTWGINAL